jgi:hypothetical protein
MTKQCAEPSSLLRVILAVPRDVLVLRLTALMLITTSNYSWFVNEPMILIGSVLLLARGTALRAELWCVLSTVLAFGLATLWFDADNHRYLQLYWTFACFLYSATLGSAGSLVDLRMVARSLIGLVFAAAVIWKVGTGQFLDGTMLEFTMLTDTRASLLSRLGALTVAEVKANATVLETLISWPTSGPALPLQTTNAVHVISICASWLTILVEGAIAAAFLLPVGGWLARARNVLLISFVAGTYPVLPVTSFGMVLAIMGLAQCAADEEKTAAAYLFSMAWVGVITAVVNSGILGG